MVKTKCQAFGITLLGSASKYYQTMKVRLCSSPYYIRKWNVNGNLYIIYFLQLFLCFSIC